MQGLAVIDGDLALSGSTLLTVSGAARIKQDLNFALHDEYGADPNHPFWGSILDRFIGQPLTATVQQQVTSEVQRILTNYVAVQADQVNRAVINNVRGNLNTSDIVRSIVAINVSLAMDSIRIEVELETMAKETVTVTRMVTV